MGRTLIGVVVVTVFAIEVVAQNGPATQPARSGPTKEPGAVLILPFVMPSDSRLKDSGRAIQQDLASAIASDLRGHISAPATAGPAASAEAALAMARESNSSAVVFGQMQVNDEQVRLTGQVLDAGSGKSLGSLRQSGRIEGLFGLEDAMVSQVLAALPEPLLNLRGLLNGQQNTHPQIIYLPGDAATAQLPQGPIDGGYAGPTTPYTLPPPPGGPPPYSPNAGSYPYRFRAPYAHLFTYDYDPDPFLLLCGGLYPACYPDRFGHWEPFHAHAEREQPEGNGRRR